jgi:hypothetical protein
MKAVKKRKTISKQHQKTTMADTKASTKLPETPIK